MMTSNYGISFSMKKLICTISIAFILCFGCKKDEPFNTSLFDDYYYTATVYRDYPNDLSLDTFKYYLNKDTLTVIGYTYDRVNNIKTPVKKDTVSHSYYIKDNNIYFPPQTANYYETQKNYLFGPLEFHLMRWEIIKLDNSKLVVEGYNSDKLISHFELIAHPKK